MRQSFCPICNSICIHPSNLDKDLLILGGFPEREDLLQGRPFAINSNFMTGGKILKKELEQVGASLQDFALGYLWQHEPNKNEECFTSGYEHALEIAKGKKAILLVGADVVEVFTTFKVSDVSGLQVDSHILSAPIIYAVVNPSLAQHRALGEVRHGITKFVARLEKEGLI